MQKTITPEEARLAGIDPDDAQSMNNLERQLAEWDYTIPQNALDAYSGNNIICLQLLRQIKYLTLNNKLVELRRKVGGTGHNEIGPSMLYDALSNSKAKSKSSWTWVQDAVRNDGGNLQEAWLGLGKSTDITKFTRKYKLYLEGYIGENNKWHRIPRQENISLSPTSQTPIIDQHTPRDELAAYKQAAPALANNNTEKWSSESPLTQEEDILAFVQGDAQAGLRLYHKRSISQDEFKKIRQTAEDNGLLGEKLVAIYFESCLTQKSIHSYRWISQEDATSPYDFLLTDNSRIDYVLDVKSTSGNFTSCIYVSMREIEYMAKRVERYDIYRIYNLTEKGGKLRIAEGVRDFAQSILDSLNSLPSGVYVDSISIDTKKIEDLFGKEIELHITS